MLIGREHEQRTIDRLVSGARIGASGVLAVTGEPGVGKSALLRWSEGRLDGFRVLRATGTEPEREVPFAGLLTVLGPALGLLDKIAAPQARALSAALAMEEGSAGDRFAIGAATLSLLCRYAEEAPVAVLLDDLQLLDRPSAGALVFAARRLSADPVAVLMTARAGEADDLVEGLDALVVTGLDLVGARSLVESLVESLADRPTATPVTDEWLLRVHGLTGGNPLAITELTEDPAVLLPSGSDVPPPLSAALTASFTRRVRVLDPGVRAVLLAAVVCNGDLRLTGSVCAALDLDIAGIEAVADSGLVVVSGGDIVFRHPLLRSAIYRDSPPSERRAVHAAVAGALPDVEVDRRAWHLSESLWGRDASIASMLDGAGARAAARSAYAVASTAYERSARLSPDLGDLATRLVAAAENAWDAGLASRAISLLDELAPAAVAPELTTRALELRAAIVVRTGSVREAAALLEHAAAETASADARAVLLGQALHATMFLADGAAAGRLVDLLTSAVAQATSSRARGIGTVATGMAKVLAGRGGIEELRAAVPLLAGSAELRADAHGLSWLMYAPLFLRDAQSGRELRERVDEARARAGVGTLPGLLFLVARDGATTDSWARAAADYTEAIRLARDTGQATELAMSLAGLSWVEARTGQEASCRTHAAETLALCGGREIHWGEAWALFSLGDLELSLGNPAAALEHLQRLDALLEELSVADPDLSPRAELVDVLLRLGRVDEASVVAAAYLDAADTKGQPWARARARRCTGLLADDFDAAFEQALALHEETLDRFETARTCLAYGERLRRSGRRIDARVQLRRALDDFTTLGAQVWAERAATELDLTGERVPRRAPDGIDSLTPQELQVALLLADGRTTREAAAALFLSPKTVEYHLRKVYTKLDIRSREELARVLAPPADRAGTAPDAD